MDLVPYNTLFTIKKLYPVDNIIENNKKILIYIVPLYIPNIIKNSPGKEEVRGNEILLIININHSNEKIGIKVAIPLK